MAGSLAEEIDSRFFEHGGRLDAAREVYPGAPEPWIDLSTGISPWAYPAPQLPPLELQRLPDAGALHKLAAVAKEAYRAPEAAQIVALPGTDAGLSVLPWLFREPKRVGVLSPAYSGHATAWAAAGHSVSEIESLDRAGNAAILIVVNPNNPDGRFIPHESLAAALPALRRRNGLLIIDEAFADADESHSVLPAVTRLDYTLVFRSAGKFYGAGGVRLGFAVTSHPVAERLRSALGAWPVTAHALAFGLAALSDKPWAAGQRARLEEGAGALDALLKENGFRAIRGTPLFRLGEHQKSPQIFTRLASNGILTRPFRNRHLLRFGLPGSAEALVRLQKSLQEAVKQ